MKKWFLLPALGFLLITSCKTKDENCTLSATSILGTYKITAATATSGGTVVDLLNNPAYFEPCEKDDIITLKAGGIAEYKDAGVVCSPANNYNDGWVLQGDEFTVGMDSGKVTYFSCNSFEITSTISVMGQNVTMKTVFTRQ